MKVDIQHVKSVHDGELGGIKYNDAWNEENETCKGISKPKILQMQACHYAHFVFLQLNSKVF